MPFYIDIVHISPPWRGDMGWRAQNKEDLRVGEANAAAYLGAALVVLAVPERGDGLYSVVEQRLGTFGTYRLLPLGPWGDDTPAEEDSDPEEVTDGKDTKPFDRTNVAEVNLTFYPYQGKSAYRGVPRVPGVPLVRWPDAERTAYEKGQGLQGVEVGTAYPVESVAGFAVNKPRFMLKPMYKQSSHGIRSDGSLSADPYDFSGNGLNRFPMDCKMDRCNCPDSEGCKVPNKVRTFLKKRRIIDHVGSTYAKKPQQPLDPELWRQYRIPHPDPAPTLVFSDDDDLIFQALSPPRRPVQTGIFQYPRSWYLANRVKPPDTAENELIYGTSDEEEEEQPIQQIHAAFINIDSDSDDDLSQRDNNGNTEDEESEIKQGDSSDDATALTIPQE
ncbi:hypothetical protein N7455_007191 [Penicillium solitum]|uniref:uncharacterized protein n=1 Tax=Penicillium solitum TaxID=60172 RepID=UPI0032C3E62C|nr:hypothetical protein N7455_007191 [Penicillium solitum]